MSDWDGRDRRNGRPRASVAALVGITTAMATAVAIAAALLSGGMFLGRMDTNITALSVRVEQNLTAAQHQIDQLSSWLARVNDKVDKVDRRVALPETPRPLQQP